jgi:Mrp family chromosome partitioning ATPase
MGWLLEELSARADLVIIDTPPMLVVSDAIPLLKQASGVVVIGRVNQTTRDTMRRAVQVIATAGGSVVGAIATGSKRSGLYGYGAYYGGYYATREGAIAGAEASFNGSPESGQPAAAGLFRSTRARLSGR